MAFATTSGGRSRGGGRSSTTPAHVIDATKIGFDDDDANVAQPPTSSSSAAAAAARGRLRNSNTTKAASASAKRKSRGEGHHDKTTMEEEMDEDEEDEEEDDEDALTLGDRVRALEVSVNGATTSAEKTLGAGDGKNDETTTAAPTFVPPKADSLATLLAQALAADDVQLLERCLSVHDKRAIETTVGRLSGPLAMKLLSICIDNMKDKPNRGERLAKWCRATLVRHAGFASVSPNAQKTLTHLQAQIDARTAQREPLLQLMGRLDLLLYASSRDEVQDACENVRLNEDERGIPAAEYHEAVDVLDDLVVGGGEGESEEDFDDDDNSEGEEWETDDGEDDDDDDDEEEMDSEDEEDPFAKSDRHEDLEDEEEEEEEEEEDD
jgi:U3 small nucleolar RNA-associated protein 5